MVHITHLCSFLVIVGMPFFWALPHGNFSYWASIRIAVDGRICLFPLELRPAGWPMDLGGAVNPRPVYKRLRSGHLDCFWLNGAGYCWILLVKPSKTQTPKKQSSNIQQYPAISGNIRQYPALNRRCKELGAPSLVAAKLRTAPSQPSPAPRWPLRLEIPISWP